MTQRGAVRATGPTGTGNPQSGSRRPAPGRSRARYGTSRWTNDLAVAARIDLDSPLRMRSVPAVWCPRQQRRSRLVRTPHRQARPCLCPVLPCASSRPRRSRKRPGGTGSRTMDLAVRTPRRARARQTTAREPTARIRPGQEQGQRQGQKQGLTSAAARSGADRRRDTVLGTHRARTGTRDRPGVTAVIISRFSARPEDAFDQQRRVAAGRSVQVSDATCSSIWCIRSIAPGPNRIVGTPSARAAAPTRR